MQRKPCSLCISLFRVLFSWICNCRIQAIAGNFLSALEAGKFHHNDNANHYAAQRLNQLNHSLCRTACSNQVVNHKHLLSRFDGILVHLNHSSTVLEIVFLLYSLTWQFALLANENKRLVLIVCDRGAENETSGLRTDDVIKIDTAVFNPARIIKLYGTMAQKGANIESAPHRMAQIVTLPDNYYDDVNDKVLVEKIANMLPKEEKPQRYNNYKPSAFDVRAWLDEHRIEYTSSAFTGGTKYVLRECPFDSNHKGKDAAIFQMDSGAIAFKCFHNSCADKTWRDVRLKYEPHAYDYSAHPATPNSQRPNYKPPKIKEEEAPDIPSWLTTSYINNLKQQTHEFIPTGIKGIDRVMRGFQKGSVTCLSGLRAAGKSSLISELILNAAQQGYKSALFSGELTAQKALNWIMLQAAGKNFVQPTEYDNFYVVEPPIKEKIASWLNDKLFIFNNQKGNKYDYILQAIEDCVQKKKIDLVILDNLMALDITMLSGDKYERQSQFIKMLTQYAKRADIAIIFVAHPRKAMGFLRLEDVSGNADLTNAADSVFIIHRVNNDFRRLSKEMFKWKDDNDCYLADNVIEICKDRESGNQDVFVPLYYERASKRLKNSRDEHIVYNWQEAIEKNEKTDKSLWDDFEDIEIIEGDDDLPWN